MPDPATLVERLRHREATTRAFMAEHGLTGQEPYGQMADDLRDAADALDRADAAEAQAATLREARESSEPTEAITEKELTLIIGMSPAGRCVVQACAGEWRKRADGRWEFWDDPEWDE
jgi:hypothetical protein